MRTIYIPDYVNELYESMVDARRAVGEPAPERQLASPRHPESVLLKGLGTAISVELGPLPQYVGMK